MGKKTALILKIIYGVIIIGAVISMVIAKNDIYNGVGKVFIIGYLLIILLYVLIMISITLLKIKRMDIRKRRKVINKFMTLFLIIFIFNCILNYINVRDIDVITQLVNALGISFIFLTINVMFLQAK